MSLFDRLRALAETAAGPVAAVTGAAVDAGSAAVDKIKETADELSEHPLVGQALAWWDAHVTHAADDPALAEAAAKRATLIAKAFDGLKVSIAGRELGLGADALLGVVPGGRSVAHGAHLYLLAEALRFGAPTSLVARQVARAVADGVAGAIPIAGPLLGATRMSHSKNAKELVSYLEEAADGARSNADPVLVPV